MLCMNSYKQAYVDECRASMEAQLAAYKSLLTAARERPGLTARLSTQQPLLNRGSITSSWFWTATLFNAAGRSKARMGMPLLSFG